MFPRFLALVFLMTVTAGCGVKSVPGGTTGQLFADGVPLSEIQVTVHTVDQGSAQPIGFGVTATDGSFDLVTNRAQGPLWLSSGEYRCTLESVGAPVRLPKEYLHADTTPLKVTWSSDGDLDLQIPPVPPLR